MSRRLREARIAKGLSQKRLGVLVGIDPSSASSRINQYERDKYVPDFRIAERLANRLDVPVTYLYAEDDRLARMILAFVALPARKQSKVLRLMESGSVE